MPRFTARSKRNGVTFLSHHPSVHHYQSGKELNVFVFGEGVVKDKPSTFKILNNLNMMYKNVANSSEIFNSFCLREEVLPTWKRTDFQGCRDTLSRRYQVGIVLCARKIQRFIAFPKKCEFLITPIQSKKYIWILNFFKSYVSSLWKICGSLYYSCTWMVIVQCQCPCVRSA